MFKDKGKGVTNYDKKEERTSVPTAAATPQNCWICKKPMMGFGGGKNLCSKVCFEKWKSSKEASTEYLKEERQAGKTGRRVLGIREPRAPPAPQTLPAKPIEKSRIVLELKVGDVLESKCGFIVESALTDAKYRVFKVRILPNGGMESIKRELVMPNESL